MNEKMRSCVMGLILGQFSSPLSMAQKEPVAYLYNGVRLPKLPEWDRETYPYALIYKEELTNYIKLICADCEMVYVVDVFGGNFVSFPYDVTFHYHEYILQDTEFVFEKTVTNSDPNGPGIFSGEFIWTNHDIRKELEDYTLGEVVYPPSEPIPIYE